MVADELDYRENDLKRNKVINRVLLIFMIFSADITVFSNEGEIGIPILLKEM